MEPFAIEAFGLTKIFPGGVDAVRGLELTIPPGTVYGLVGRNGAGKTTTLRLLMGLLRPTAGETRVLGASMAAAPRSHRARAAYVSQAQSLPRSMTLQELARFVSTYYAAWNDEAVRDLTARFELPLDRPVGTLSGGQQRKAAMVLAIAARPEVLLLDEPGAGLDPVARRQFVEAVIELVSENESCTVLLSTHLLADLERLATRIGFLDRGRLVRESDLDALKERFRRVQAIFDEDGPPDGFRLPGAVRQRTEGPVVTGVIELDDPAGLEALRRMPGVRVTEFPLGLEDLMIELFGPSGDNVAADHERNRERTEQEGLSR